MFIIKGTLHRTSPIDFFQRCKKCGKLFYFSHDSNGATVVCPHCGAMH